MITNRILRQIYLIFSILNKSLHYKLNASLFNTHIELKANASAIYTQAQTNNLLHDKSYITYKEEWQWLVMAVCDVDVVTGHN